MGGGWNPPRPLASRAVRRICAKLKIYFGSSPNTFGLRLVPSSVPSVKMHQDLQIPTSNFIVKILSAKTPETSYWREA